MTTQQWIAVDDLLCLRVRSPMYIIDEDSETGRAVSGMSSRSTRLCDQMGTRTPPVGSAGALCKSRSCMVPLSGEGVEGLALLSCLIATPCATHRVHQLTRPG